MFHLFNHLPETQDILIRAYHFPTDNGIHTFTILRFSLIDTRSF